MQEINIYTDGGSRGNPGPAAIGVWVESLKKVADSLVNKALDEESDCFSVICRGGALCLLNW